VSASQPVAAPRDLLTAWGDWGPTSSTWAGADVNESTMFNLVTVFGCNRFIADGISTLPIHTFRDEGTVRTRTDKPDWLDKPTIDLDFVAWSTQCLTSWLSVGDVFAMPQYTGRPGRGAVSEVPILDPAMVDVTRDNGRKVITINGKPVERGVLHSPGMMWPGAVRGMSPLEAARQTIGAGLSAEEYAARFFGEGSVPDGVIEVPTDLDPAELRQIARGWAKDHGGNAKRGLPGVLKGGASWKPTAVTNEQAQFLQTRKFTEVQIAAQMFRIDPTEMGLAVEGQSLTYSNAEERAIRKVQVTFLPWIVRVERALSNLLPRPQYVKFNTSALLRGDTLARFGAYQLGLTNGFMTVNEVRDLEDWKPLPGGDVATPRTTPAPQEAP
jgi:HK97 family phage portal protein